MTHSTSKSTLGEGRFAFLLLDSSFKVVVCSPENSGLLIKIIELLLPGKHISNIIFLDKEKHGFVIEEKSSTFDLLCQDKDTGEEFLVELQNRGKASYRDRMLVYATFPIREQMAEKYKSRRKQLEAKNRGEDVGPIDRMDYSLKPIYVISLINFDFAHEADGALDQEYISRYKMRNDQNGEVLTDNLSMVFLEMDRLKLGPKDHGKCKNLLERFIFSIKYMHLLSERPKDFDDPLLVELYNASELATMSVMKRQKYDSIMYTEIDRLSELTYACEKASAEGEAKGKAEGIAIGEAKGKAEERAEMILLLYESGMSVKEISERTKIPEEEIQASLKP